MDNVKIFNNSCAKSGGGIHILEGSNITLKNVDFIDNKAKA